MSRFTPTISHPAYPTPNGCRSLVSAGGSSSPRRHIRRRELEIDAIVNARIRAFVLGTADLTGPEQATVFAAALPRTNRLATASRGPLIGRIGKSGGVSTLRLPGVAVSRDSRYDLRSCKNSDSAR
jgi:hypothetical protein